MKHFIFLLTLCLGITFQAHAQYDDKAFASEIRLFKGTVAPPGWLICEGQLLDIQAHSLLAQLIWNEYGGDGQKTIALPNFKDSPRPAGWNYFICTNGEFPSRDRVPNMDHDYIGEIRLLAMTTSYPNETYLCNGQLKQIAYHDYLFGKLISMNYGGDGRNTFALPNLKGKGPIHKDAQGNTKSVDNYHLMPYGLQWDDGKQNPQNWKSNEAHLFAFDIHRKPNKQIITPAELKDKAPQSVYHSIPTYYGALVNNQQQAASSIPIAGKKFYIKNTTHSNYGAMLSWTNPTSGHPMAHLSTSNPTKWEFQAVSGKANTYKIISTTPGQWQGASISWDSHDPHPLISVEHNDPVEWRMDPVPGKPNTYKIVNTYAGTWQDASISCENTTPDSPASLKFNDPLEWELVLVK